MGIEVSLDDRFYCSITMEGMIHMDLYTKVYIL